MVGEVNGLQEKEELTAEEQPVEEMTETEDTPADVTVEDVPAEEDKAAALEAQLKEKGDRILRLQPPAQAKPQTLPRLLKYQEEL